MNWLKRFMAHPPLRQITLVNVQDDELVERTKARQDEARKALGLKWIGHPAAPYTVERMARLHEQALVENAEFDRVAAMHRGHRVIRFREKQ